MTTTETAVFVPTTKRTSLYDIDAEFAALDQLLEEIPEDDTEASAILGKWWEELQGRLEEKLQRCVAWSKQQEYLANAATEEAKRLRRIAEIHNNRIDRLKRLIRETFEHNGIKKVETPLGPVRLVANGGRAPLIVDAPLSSLPADCKRVVEEADKEAIRAKLEAGEKIEGARIGERGVQVRLG